MRLRTEPIQELEDDVVLASKDAAHGGGARQIELPIDDAVWKASDEIRCEITMPPEFASDGVFRSIECNIDLEYRSPGFDSPDGYWCSALVSPRAGNLWEGTREFRMPAECFYTRGIPAGWTDLHAATITVPEGCGIGAVRLVTRERTPGPRMTDAALIAATDASARADTENDRERADALAKLVERFRASGYERRLERLASPPPDSRELADNIADGLILGYDWSDGIDWQANPSGYIEWSIRVHFLSYLRPLISAWRHTSNSRYVRAIERIVHDWIRSNPVPYAMRGCGLAWGHSLVVAYRGFDVFVDAFECLLSSPEVSDQSIIDAAKSIWEHAEYLLAFQSFPPSNKSIAEARTLGAIGCTMPEFVDAPRWRESAYRSLVDDMEIQVFPDGASYELSPGYQLAIAAWFLEAYETARRYGHPVPPTLESGIRSMYRWSASIIRPDFSRPSVSDASSLNVHYGEDLAGPGRILDDEFLTWVGTEGEEGSPPHFTSIGLVDSGYSVMRSGWDRDARYLLFEGGSFGRFHQHEDMLSFDLAAYDTEFIVDPGISSYFPNPWTEWYRTTAAHNTILIDGHGQNRRTCEGIDQWTESARDRTIFRNTDRYDVASAAYHGCYGDIEERFSHLRAIIFVKPDYFIVFDSIEGPGTHTSETLFHFMPFRVLIDDETRAVRTGRQDSANIEIVPLGPGEPRLVCGQNNPVQGWLAIDRQDVPAPVAIYTDHGLLPRRMGYLIVPYGPERVTAEATATVETGADSWEIEVDVPGRHDRISVDWTSLPIPELVETRHTR